MAEPSTHINYSFEDIQRYLQGKMSAAEMHDIEKAALQDSFLADAIEGYREVSSTTAQQQLNEINASLQKQQQASKVISINKQTQWLRIAAIIIVLAGVGVIGTYFFKTSNRQQQVAQVKKETANENNSVAKDSVATITPETTSINKNITAAITQNKNQQNARSFKKEKRTESKIYADTITDNEATASVTAAPAEQNNKAIKSFAPVPLSNQNNDSQLNDLQGKISGLSIAANTFAGKVVDANNRPLPGVVIEANDKQKSAVTDLNGNFVLQNNDSILNVTATTVGYENKNASLKSNEDNVIALQENHANLNEVVVVGYGAKKNKSLNQKPTPVGGWTNFNNYVATQLNKDSTGSENYISDNDVVELEFLIDDEGNPYNIHITKPLDEQKNSKAIDILKSGPKWTSTSKKKKAKVAIAF